MNFKSNSGSPLYVTPAVTILLACILCMIPEIKAASALNKADDGFGCIALWQPVCSSDNKVYGNSCEAAISNAEIACELDPLNDSCGSLRTCFCTPEPTCPANVPYSGWKQVPVSMDV